MESAQDLHRDLSKSSEASHSRIRLWAEDRLRKERAVMEESLERAGAHAGMVRTLLDEAVKAVSKELEILRSEARARNEALEESLDERASDLETRLTEIDNGSAKKRRVSELTKETGARIGEVERRVRQVRRVMAVEQLDRRFYGYIAFLSGIGGMAEKLRPVAAATKRLHPPRYISFNQVYYIPKPGTEERSQHMLQTGGQHLLETRQGERKRGASTRCFVT